MLAHEAAQPAAVAVAARRRRGPLRRALYALGAAFIRLHELDARHNHLDDESLSSIWPRCC